MPVTKVTGTMKIDGKTGEHHLALSALRLSLYGTTKEQKDFMARWSLTRSATRRGNNEQLVNFAYEILGGKKP